MKFSISCEVKHTGSRLYNRYEEWIVGGGGMGRRIEILVTEGFGLVSIGKVGQLKSNFVEIVCK